ncbi:MAG: STAS domain-containing protein [Spirochaetia bacterium]|nr:STAS domain-containing protein [Spirochaetia bacterium]
MEQIKFQINSVRDISIVNVEGRLDFDTCETLMDAIVNLVKSGKVKIVVEMSKSDYISSAGWSIFIANLRETHRRKGDIFLCGMNSHVKDVYDLLELHEILKSFENVQDALSVFELQLSK